MRILFMGSGEFAVPALKSLVKSEHDIIGVVTQPDRQSGRVKKIQNTPIKQIAIMEGLNIYQPEKVRSTEFLETIKQINPELSVVASFGQIIPQTVLDIPKFGNINIHASLLPKYRGAAPVHYAIFNGDVKTGVTTMMMDAGIDTGPILLQTEIAIDKNDDRGDLEKKLAEAGSILITETIRRLILGDLNPIPQDGKISTYAPSITRNDCKIDWRKPADEIRNKIRGCTPKPGAYCITKNGALKIWKAETTDFESINNIAGMIVDISAGGITINTGAGLLKLIEVQPENRNRMSASEYARGYNISPKMNFILDL